MHFTLSIDTSDQGSAVVLCRRLTPDVSVNFRGSLTHSYTVAVKIPQLQHLIPDPWDASTYANKPRIRDQFWLLVIS